MASASASASAFILHPPLFHHSKLKQSNFLLQKFNIQIPNYRLSVLPSTSSDWEREEVRWIQEEQRWVREEKRWIREESRWRSERELLSKESDMLRIKIESLRTGTNMDGEVEVGGERLVIPEIMEVTEIIVEGKKEVEASAFEVNVSKRDNDTEKKIEGRKVLRMGVQGDDVKELQWQPFGGIMHNITTLFSKDGCIIIKNCSSSSLKKKEKLDTSLTNFTLNS